MMRPLLIKLVSNVVQFSVDRNGIEAFFQIATAL